MRPMDQARSGDDAYLVDLPSPLSFSLSLAHRHSSCLVRVQMTDEGAV